MSNVSVIGVDTAKNVFHFWGVNREGREVFRRRVYRSDMEEFLVKLPPCHVALEACGGSHYWGRRFQEHGFTVSLLPPQYVKAYVKTNKSDWKDAEAIAEAAQRPGMRRVSVKTVEQLELQHLHRGRERVMKDVTARGNALRGMLGEYGVVIPKGKRAIKYIPELLHKLPPLAKRVLDRALQQYHAMVEELKWYDEQVRTIADKHPVCRRLQTVPGVGPVIATALVAAVSDAASYKNGRQFSASLGIVPKHRGTGGKNLLLSISKRGDKYLRKQLIHGARSIMIRAHLRTDRLSAWITALKERKGANRTAVAIANKVARICWRILRYEEEFELNRAAA